jgi:hypothetical protein
MLETSPEATESHSRLVLQLQLLAAVYRMLEGYLADGQVVSMSPEEISKLRID